MFNMLFIQLLGLIAFVLLFISYFKEDIDGVLLMQVISGIFYALHYYFLGAYSSLFVIIFELIRDYSYYRTDLDRYIFIGTIPIYLIYAVFMFDGVISLLPIVSSVIDGYGLAISKKTAVIGAMISETLWFVYDLSCLSYAGVISEIFLIGSYIFVLFKDSKGFSK